MSTSLGQQFADALGHKDSAALKVLLCDEVDFRAMTPGRFWEASNVDEVVDATFFGAWFEPDDRITAIRSIETGRVGSRQRVRYEFELTSGDEDFLVEQQAYFDLDAAGERISWLRIICSGFQPVASS